MTIQGLLPTQSFLLLCVKLLDLLANLVIVVVNTFYEVYFLSLF